MLFDYRKSRRAIAIAVLLMEVMMPVAMAEEDHDEEGSKYVSTVTNAKWKAECGACHVNYPPDLLPAESWRALMSGLDKHFGSDASLDAATAREISGFLEQNAGGEKFASQMFVSRGKPVLRITETRWFRNKHDEVSKRDWGNPKVKSPANCSACHTQAESGNYSEHSVRIPN
jgi:nitrate/TMAO reductase-like tetraheme cytochrome c subunit